jgi:glycosyltransferase involved in cell wall biosynthesis
MKVLLAHDYYRSTAPSGEDAVFRNEHALLESKGVEVVLFERFNDDIDDSTINKRLDVAFEGAWSKTAYQDITEIIRRTRPDVAHFHNTFPLISPSAYAACQDNGVPVVQTLHNYRFICPGALLMREGKPCEACVGTSLLPALRYRCYRGSLAATGAQVWTIASNRWRGSYRNNVNRYIALTQFAVNKLTTGGLPRERIEVKSNFLPAVPSVGMGGGGYALYAGRLSAEKGIQTLINAWKDIQGLQLKVFGDGVLRAQLVEQVKRDGSNVEFMGFRPAEDVLAFASRAEMMIIPSECYEGFPMAVLEAYACGTPVVASHIGSLDEIVVEGKTGVKFEPGNAIDLVKKVNFLLSDKAGLIEMRRHARAMFDNHYTAEKNYIQLMNIYQNAIEDFELHRGSL